MIKFQKLIEQYINNFGMDSKLVYGAKMASKFMDLNKIIAVDAIENGVIFTFQSFEDDHIMNLIVEGEQEVEIEFLTIKGDGFENQD